MADGITEARIAEWRALQGEGMTSAVGESTPDEFWELLDAYEAMTAAKPADGDAVGLRLAAIADALDEAWLPSTETIELREIAAALASPPPVKCPQCQASLPDNFASRYCPKCSADMPFAESKAPPVKDEVIERVHVVFDGPPGPDAGRFVECETPDGRGINAGEWHERGDGYWELRLTLAQPSPQAEVIERVRETLIEALAFVEKIEGQHDKHYLIGGKIAESLAALSSDGRGE